MTPPESVGAWVGRAAAELAAAGIERPRAEARALLAGVLDEAPARIFGYPEALLDPGRQAAAAAALRSRLAGTPLSRRFGRREFWSLTFEIGAETLDPRPETETLVEAALAAYGREGPRRILDFGVGSGCILLALLSEWPGVWGLGVDIAPGAAAIARRNAERLGLADRAAFVVGDWGEALDVDGGFDLIVANPPYVAERDGPPVDRATREHDPPRALWAGADGLDAYRALGPATRRLLAPGGLAIFEIGFGQADGATAALAAAGLAPVGRRADLAGRDRALLLKVRQ